MCRKRKKKSKKHFSVLSSAMQQKKKLFHFIYRATRYLPLEWIHPTHLEALVPSLAAAPAPDPVPAPAPAVASAYICSRVVWSAGIAPKCCSASFSRRRPILNTAEVGSSRLSKSPYTCRTRIIRRDETLIGVQHNNYQQQRHRHDSITNTMHTLHITSHVYT
jgi:hypothetical protein